MATISRSATASVDASTAAVAPQITGLIAAVDIDAAAACYITSSGTIDLCDATAADEKAVLAGFAARAAKAGQPVTLFGAGARFRYAAGMTPGTILFLSATAGKLDDAPTLGDTVGVAQAISPTDIRVTTNITIVDTANGAS